MNHSNEHRGDNRGVSGIVAVSQRIDVIKSYGETRDALDQNLIRWIAENGYQPMPVPNRLVLTRMKSVDSNTLLSAWLEQVNPAAILLTGGNNIGEFKSRDETEINLLTWARDRELPVLGICRGMQMMSVHAGAGLAPVSGHVRTRHQLNVLDEARRYPESVNSYHDYIVSSAPSGYIVTARSEDGNIEAMRHESLPWEGWMWHPEREETFSEVDSKNLKVLFGSAESYTGTESR